jgi:excisionase family DNA binding protein
METYYGGKQAAEKLGVHQRTLYQWEEKGKIETIRTPGGKRLYNVNKYIKEQQDDNIINEKIKIVYVRVSSNSQKDDLERQKNICLKGILNMY